MIGLKMSWFYFIFFFSFIIGNLEASHHRKKNPSAVVVGTVYCDTCFQDDFSKSSYFISGASVAVECKDETSKPSFQQEVKTDEHGEFKVNLPFSVREHVKKIKRCSVKLISSSEPYCAVASTATSSSLHLKERKQGIHIFSAGFFTFKPLKQPSLCNKKPSLENSKELNSKKTSVPPFSNPAIFPPPIQDPPTPGLPSIPLLPRLPPLPQLPTQPPLPGLANLPPTPGNIPGKKPEEPSRVTKLSEQKAAHPDCFFPPSPPSPPPCSPPSPPSPPPCSPPSLLTPPPCSPLNPMPPVPGLTPLPQLPTLPPLPGLPNLPRLPGNVPGKKPEEPSRVTKLSEQKAAHPDCFFPPLPPNPFLPAPPLLPSPLQPPPFCPPSPLTPPPCFSPNPSQPPPLPPYQYQPPPNFPPNPRKPPPSPRYRKPPPSPRYRRPPPSPRYPMSPVPGLTPSSKPSFPFLFPFPPIPLPFPGIPPASSSPNKLSP